MLQLGAVVLVDAGLGGVVSKSRYVPALKGFVLVSDMARHLFFLLTNCAMSATTVL